MDFSQIDIINADKILTKISQEELWRYYCQSFKEIGKLFKSELRVDNTPTCGLYYNSSGSLNYKDFGTGEHYDIFNYIMKKYNCNYYESLNIISSDFKLSDIKNDITPNIILANDIPKIKKVSIKPKIEVLKQSFNIVDYNYWKQYEISLNQLVEWNISSLKSYTLIKGEDRFIFQCTKNNPIYYYDFGDKGEIYRPYNQGNRFLYIGEGIIIKGLDKLPQEDDLLIITKSYKDVLCLYNAGYNSICFNSESKFIPEDIINELKKRFREIIILYDNDEVGRNNAKNLQNRFNFRIIEVPISTNCKDISDFIKKYGIEKTKVLLKKLIYV